MQPPDYGLVIDSAMNIAGEYKTGGSFDDAQKIISAAGRLGRAVQTKDPGQLAAAALALAEAIQLAKVDDREGATGAEGEKKAIQDRYQRAGAVITFAGAALKAATAKPRPNYPAALEATTQLIADLTESKKLDQVAVLNRTFDAWTAAVRSKDEKAIMAAGQAFGLAINDMRSIIEKDRADAKAAAQAQLAPGEQLPADTSPDVLPSIPIESGLSTLPGQEIALEQLTFDPASGDPIAIVTTTESNARVNLSPRASTPGANYSVVPGDTISGIAQRFDTTVATLRERNPQLDKDKIYVGQGLYVPGAEKRLTPGVSTSEVLTAVIGPDGKPLPKDDKKPADVAPDDKLTPKQQLALDIIEILVNGAAYFQHPVAKAYLDEWKKLKSAVETHDKKDATGWAKAKADLELLSNTVKFGELFTKEMAALETYFGNAEAKAQVRAGLQVAGRFRRNIERVLRFGGIFADIAGAADDMVVMCGYDKDLSGKEASIKDRLQAAYNLTGPIPNPGKDLPRVLNVAGYVAKKLGAAQAVEGWSIVSQVTNKFGRGTSEVFAKWIKPVLYKAATTEGVEAEKRLAYRIASELGGLVGEFAASNSNQVLKATAKVVGERLGFALRIGVSAEFGIALAIVELEAQFVADLYKTALPSFTMVFSVADFGRQANVLKREVRGKQVSSGETADALFRYLLEGGGSAPGSWLQSARAPIKTAWWQYSMQQMGNRPELLMERQTFYANPVAYVRPIADCATKVLLAARRTAAGRFRGQPTDHPAIRMLFAVAVARLVKTGGR